MSNNSTLLEKAVTTTSNPGLAVAGLMNADQSNRFIDYMWDATALARDGRVVRMRADTTEIDKVSVGSKLVRLATEAVDDGVNADPAFTKINLTTKKLRLDWEISAESLEDNIEEGSLEDTIARLMATQAGNDIEDLAINGDTTLTGDALYKAFDGFRKLAINNGRVVAGGGAVITRATFNAALKELPRKYKQRRNQLKFYTGSNLVQDYLYNVATTSGSLVQPESLAADIITGRTTGPQGGGGGTYPLAFGIPVFEVPLFVETKSGTYSGASGNHGQVELTFPDNRIWGVKREIRVNSQYHQKKDTYEFTMFTRVGIQVENWDAYVFVKDVKVSS